MGTFGKISPIIKEGSNSGIHTMQSSLASKRMTRIPGTGVYKTPYKELNGTYRTGLDPNAAYIKRIQDPEVRELEIKRVTDLLKEMQQSFPGVDLSPTSNFWNYAKAKPHASELHVHPVKLIDGDNLFPFSDPHKKLQFAWLRVHPTIASSYQAWERGEYPSETQFYVVDDEIENKLMFSKKQAINKAVVALDTMSLEKRKKIGRLMGLPITDVTPEEAVYNQIDTLIKQSEFKTGAHKGLNPVSVFNKYVAMSDEIVTVKDLIEQCINHSIYRVRAGGRIYEGEYEVAVDKDALLERLTDPHNQDEYILLEQKLRQKKMMLA